MSQLLADCPRCGARQMTFDVNACHLIQTAGWQSTYEVFAICRHCNRSTAFRVQQRQQGMDPLRTNDRSIMLNANYVVRGFVSIKDSHRTQAPEHIPEAIKAVFDEGATCLAVECFNAAGTMFRLCIDLATRALLPEQDRDGLNDYIRRTLGTRMRWLLDQRLLPEALRELSTCIREDGNDGAHQGTLTKTEAEDLLDFTIALLERLYTEPERLRLAQQRREARRRPATSGTS